MVVQMVESIAAAQQGLDVIERDIDLNAGIQGTVWVKNLLYLLEDSVQLGAILLGQVRCPQTTLAVLACNAAAQAKHQIVILVHDLEDFLAVTNLT